MRCEHSSGGEYNFLYYIDGRLRTIGVRRYFDTFSQIFLALLEDDLINICIC
jgi:hypothetical protein